MAFKIDMKKFKKVSSDKHHTVMQHEDGHQIKIAHQALSKENRKELERLPKMTDGQELAVKMPKELHYADGGTAPSPSPSPDGTVAGYGKQTDPEKRKAVSEGMKKAFGFADGGEVKKSKAKHPVEYEEIKEEPLEIERIKPEHPVDAEPISEDEQNMAEGGDVLDAEARKHIAAKNFAGPDRSYPIHDMAHARNALARVAQHGSPELQAKVRAKVHAKYPSLGEKKMADGGEVEAASEDDSIPSNQPGVTEGQTSAAPTPEPIDSPQAAAPALPVAPPAALGQQPGAPVVAPPAQSPASGTPTQPEPSDNEPNAIEGYQKQVSGIRDEAAAQAQQAKEQTHALNAQLSAVNNLMTDYQTHYNTLDQERKAFQDDILNKQIDPDRYLGQKDTAGKINTAIGLILGGIGGGAHGTNAAADFLNKQIDRDIDSQKANLGTSESLLNANMKQFGNLRDATDMTKIMMNDQVITKLKMAEARAASPLAKAKAQQQIGVLEQQVAPMVQQLATRRMLSSGQSVSGIDPAQLVHFLVPKEHQEAVYKEVERAQNTRQSAADILKDYDEAAASLKAAGGLGRVGALVHEPRSMSGLEAKLGTTVGDLEGSVRQAAMENVKSSFKPRKDDTDRDLAIRRQKLVDYLGTKSAAPRFKDYTGADLQQFSKTSKPTGDINLTPQQKSFADWARANPKDPRSAAVLKKLGVQ